MARFFAVDPLASKYPSLTPYQCAANTPILARELEGLESGMPFFFYPGSVLWDVAFGWIDDIKGGGRRIIQGAQQNAEARDERNYDGVHGPPVGSPAQVVHSNAKQAQGTANVIGGTAQFLQGTGEGYLMITGTALDVAEVGVVGYKALTALPKLRLGFTKGGSAARTFSYANHGGEFLDDALRMTEQGYEGLEVFETSSLRMAQTLERHSEMRTLNSLRASVQENGMNYALHYDDQIQVFQFENVNYIVNGHHRFAVAQKLGIEQLKGVSISEDYLKARYGINGFQLRLHSENAYRIGNRIRWR